MSVSFALHPEAQRTPSDRPRVAVPVPSFETRIAGLHAMLDVAGPDAVASHAAAAHVWGFGDLVPWRTEVALPRCDRYRVRKVRAHRSVDLTADDVTVCDGTPVTTVARMLIDLSARCSLWQLLECFDRAEARGLVSVPDLRTALGRVRQAPGRRPSVVRALIAARAGADVRPEPLALRAQCVVAAAGLPPLVPDVQVRIGLQTHRIALAYPWARVAVMCDPTDALPDPAQRALRHALGVAGWRVVAARWTMSDADLVRVVGGALTRRG